MEVEKRCKVRKHAYETRPLRPVDLYLATNEEPLLVNELCLSIFRFDSCTYVAGTVRDGFRIVEISELGTVFVPDLS